MKKPILIVIIVFALAIAATYYPWQQTAETESVVETVAEANTDNFLDLPETDTASTIKYPVPETPTAFVETQGIEGSESDVTAVDTSVADDSEIQVSTPLPLLDESDNDVAAAIKQLTDVAGLFSFKSFIFGLLLRR